jgi:hypothetical protein
MTRVIHRVQIDGQVLLCKLRRSHCNLFEFSSGRRNTTLLHVNLFRAIEEQGIRSSSPAAGRDLSPRFNTAEVTRYDTSENRADLAQFT